MQRHRDVVAPNGFTRERQQVAGNVKRVDGMLGDKLQGAFDVAGYPKPRERAHHIRRPGGHLGLDTQS